MNLKEIKELIDTLTEKDIAEFELERGNEKIRIRRGNPTAAPQQVTLATTPLMAAAPAPAAVTAPAAVPVAEPQAPAPDELHIVKSPIVGTFYEASSPGTPPFVQIGDSVESGQVVCIIEAMKLMNEINAECDGEVVKVYVENGQAVQYGERLFALKPA